MSMRAARAMTPKKHPAFDMLEGWVFFGAFYFLALPMVSRKWPMRRRASLILSTEEA